MNTKKSIYLGAIVMGLAFTSCKKDVPDPEVSTPGIYNSGVFVTNEGPFVSGTGTLSFIHNATGTVSNEIFAQKNNYPLGSIVQSMTVYNGMGYIVVNNANKVEVVNAGTCELKGVISGLSKPRYFLGINSSTGYISQWGTGAGSIKVVNLLNGTIKSSIATGAGANKMVKVGDKVYVTCSGGLGTDSVVTVINTVNNTVVNTIKVGAGPSEIQVDAAGDIWVLCAGKWKIDYSALEIPGSLVRIDAATNTVNLNLPFSSIYSQPGNLSINTAKNKLFYTYNGGVISHDINATALNTTATINRSFYGLGIDPATDNIYGSDAGDYKSNGKVIRYKSTGVVIDSFAVGVIPGSFTFN